MFLESLAAERLVVLAHHLPRFHPQFQFCLACALLRDSHAYQDARPCGSLGWENQARLPYTGSGVC
jgi:hypothetical protein